MDITDLTPMNVTPARSFQARFHSLFGVTIEDPADLVGNVILNPWVIVIVNPLNPAEQIRKVLNQRSE